MKDDIIHSLDLYLEWLGLEPPCLPVKIYFITSVWEGKKMEQKGIYSLYKTMLGTVASVIRKDLLLSPVGEDRDYFKHY